MRLEAYEKGLCRKTASTFERAALRGYEPFSFVPAWFKSETAHKLYNYDFNSVRRAVYISLIHLRWKCIFRMQISCKTKSFLM